MSIATVREWLRDCYWQIVYGGTEEELDREQAARRDRQATRAKQMLDQIIAEEGPRVLEKIRGAEAKAQARRMKPSNN